MKITNKHGLPDAVYSALSKSNYSPGTSDYSVTTLLKPPQIVQLEKRHWDALEEDVIDRVWSLFGSAAHNILEGHGCEEAVTEKRMYTTILDRRVGGQIDHYLDGTITDYKVTSVWTLIYGSRYAEWEEQQNIYAYIFAENGYKVDKLQIVAILRDWDKKKAALDPNYPKTPIMIIPLNLWDKTKQYCFIQDRVASHKAAEEVDDINLPKCTPSECWQQDSQFALLKEGRKTALKVDRDMFKLESWALDNGCMGLEQVGDDAVIAKLYPQYSIVERKGTRMRCQSYCAAAQFCSQWKDFQNAKD